MIKAFSGDPNVYGFDEKAGLMLYSEIYVRPLERENAKLREALEKIKRSENCNDKTCEHTVDDSCDYNIACEALQTIEIDAILRGDK